MTATKVLAGAPIAAAIRSEAEAQAGALRRGGTVPVVAIVRAGSAPASDTYVRTLVKAAAIVGIEARLHDVVDAGDLRADLELVGDDPAVHGVILQTPLPGGLRAADVAAAIPAAKDVDGACPLSLGRLAAGLEAFAPATASAVMELLAGYQIPVAGRRVTVIGRSTVVGKPLALLLLGADATVSVCHSKTVGLASMTRTADVLVAAVGQAGLVGRAHVGPGAVVVDVGTNVTVDGTVVGDVDGAEVEGIVSARSPVPGGVGPVTTAVLLRNVVRAAWTAAGCA
ncbi:MAG TPA: bifunctional 5,10-methylenetetrahydrofolate dehydrogenase/5,10-methenyltetrahydrofolate cyclohydrolase [Acidimicrobiales bacterium]|nr:bifunctional 5,10-methylenetetrahydrofolate dehydrogenase/5,10-methenyltetrahydrofolate cyclohydrolase [Acidimicrobiales bacterium]